MRLEAYKILSSCSASLKQPHLDFVFEQISTQIPREKLDLEDFKVLSELGKYSKDGASDFQDKVAQFFWDLIISGECQNLGLLASCTQKYRDMVRTWALEKKQQLFLRLLEALREPEKPSLPCLKLLRGLIKDQHDRSAYTSSTASTSYTSASYPASTLGSYPGLGGAPATTAYSAGSTAGSALRNRTGQQAQGAASEPQDGGNDASIEEKPVVALTL